MIDDSLSLVGLTTSISFLYIGGWVVGFCLAGKNSDCDYPYQVHGGISLELEVKRNKLSIDMYDMNPQATLFRACLLAATKRGSLVVVKALLFHPLCELLARDEEGNTALHLAASGGYHEVVLELASKYDMPSGGKNDVVATSLCHCATGLLDLPTRKRVFLRFACNYSRKCGFVSTSTYNRCSYPSHAVLYH